MWPGGFAVEWITHPSHGRLPGWAFTHLDDCLSDWIHIIGTEGLYKCLKTGLELRHLSLTHTHLLSELRSSSSGTIQATP